MQEIFLLKSKEQVVDSLCLYDKTPAVPLGLHIQRIMMDTGTEYTPHVLCKGFTTASASP